MNPTTRLVLASWFVGLIVAVPALAQQPAAPQPLPPTGQSAYGQPQPSNYAQQPAYGQPPQAQLQPPQQLGAPQQPLPQQFPPQANAQQPAGVVPLPAGPPQPPQGFELNAIQQGFLDQLLSTWEVQSAKINTFKCSFERWNYDATFSPRLPSGEIIPLNKDKGEMSFQKPDKGSFQITEINRWQGTPVAPGQPASAPGQGNWTKQSEAIGEHWVCDGKSVFEYRHDQKQLVERPIPPQLQGQAIVDGPLPFLFGAEAAKLKQRYWMRIEQQPNNKEIWLTALPKYQAQAANFRAVQVILDRERLLPVAMRVRMPDGSEHRYIFDITNATVNSKFALLQSFFERPRVPTGRGWKHVVEQMPVEQAAQPAGQPLPR